MFKVLVWQRFHGLVMMAPACLFSCLTHCLMPPWIVLMKLYQCFDPAAFQQDIHRLIARPFGCVI